MGIAEPVIGRAFARPVGSTHPTKLFRIGIGKPPAGFSNLRARRNLTGGIPLRTSGSAIGLVLSCDDCNEVNVGSTAAVPTRASARLFRMPHLEQLLGADQIDLLVEPCPVHRHQRIVAGVG